MQRVSTYFRESWAEIRKVTWPTRKQAIRLTAAVLIFSVIFAIYIAFLDAMFSKLLQQLILKV